MERHRLTRQVLEAALDRVVSGSLTPNGTVRLFGQPLDELHLRESLEGSLRAMARLTEGPGKIQLVDEANRVRPRTLF
jgi:serine/threonine-protein kinase PknG